MKESWRAGVCKSKPNTGKKGPNQYDPGDSKNQVRSEAPFDPPLSEAGASSHTQTLHLRSVSDELVAQPVPFFREE